MIILTDSAKSAIQRFIDGADAAIGGLKIAVAGGGCSGLQYTMALKPSPESDDMVVPCGGVDLYIDPMSATMLDGVSIDYIESLNGSGFKFTNPNATATCACGSSFSA